MLRALHHKMPRFGSRATTVFLTLSLLFFILLLFGDGSIRQLRATEELVRVQQEHNIHLADQVADLSSQVHGIQTNDRYLEKAARNELGVARPNELIFVFEDDGVR